MLSTLVLEDFLRRHIQVRLNTTATNISSQAKLQVNLMKKMMMKIKKQKQKQAKKN